MSEYKCWYCKEEIIENDVEIAKLKIKNGSKEITRKFHKSLNCKEKYLKLKNEKEKKNNEYPEWVECYEYVKKEILGYSKEMQLTPYMRNRLQSLRNGKLLKKGESLSKDGYSYPIITLAFKMKKNHIQRAISSKVFKSENNKFDYTMAIVLNDINDLYIRHLNKEKQDKKLDAMKIETEFKQEFKNKNDINANSVANLLEDLW